MTCGVLGPGLVGCFLGAAAGAPWAVVKPGGRPRATLVRLSSGVRQWTPQVITTPRRDLPLLVTTRVHQTPWSALPPDVLAAQNGLGQPLPVATCVFAVDLDDDGVVQVTGPTPRVVVGVLPPTWAPVLAAWEAAGITVERVADPRAAQWEKAVLNATVGPLCLATRKTMAGVWSDPSLRQLTIDATVEGEALGRAAGLPISDGLVARATAFFAAVGGHRPSVLRDSGELPWVLGALLGRADESRHPVPALRRIAAMTARYLSNFCLG